ncbi:hypothetical protein CC78DRAFT_212384 [Lojkania enalia]|uniref:Zn(2)-C6 fungal-type domain-containing protein n=1 Tax=Lojkania enalia TaxID=147567 RepID=A0A9P4KAJ4_9PLEO|nr:hypothetical protein CC78DRAFT_212384 [Didymosphaeria enalia]
MSSNTASPDTFQATAPNPHVSKTFSCVLCAQRKVKCDKRPRGCANCTKARVPCVYKTPPPPRRRKKGEREIDTNTRLKLYENALRKLGVNPADLERAELSKAQAEGSAAATNRSTDEPRIPDVQDGKPALDAGVLVAQEGKSVYLDNALWTSLKEEFRDSRELLDESSDEHSMYESQGATREAVSSDVGNLLIGTSKTTLNLRTFHPQPVQIFKLWQTYLENINPLVKVFHTPTIQQIILNASSDLDAVSRSVEALLFGIYSISISSSSDSECDAIMGEPKAVVSQRFRFAAQHALINASFLKSSDTTVLQAYVLFLLSLQNFDLRIMWILTGVALRIGQRLGLHRDGEVLGLPPFETEMRRRLWWQIMFLDGHSEKLAGTANNFYMGDTKRPSNINDSQLFPGMQELPMEHEGPTEMMFFLIRCHVGEFLKRSNSRSNFDGIWNKLTTGSVSTSIKDKAINDLMDLFERKFLQYCDPSIPMHLMCSYLVKAIIGMMKFMAHSTQSPISDTDLAQSEKDMLFNIAMEVTSYQNLAYTEKQMQGFMWHVNMNFQWKAFIFLLNELRHRTHGPEVDEAWKTVRLVFKLHPRLSRELSKKALPIALGNLTLKAWDAYTAARVLSKGEDPPFIQILRSERVQSKESNGTSPSAQPFTPQVQPMTSYGDNSKLSTNFQQDLFPDQSFSLDRTFAASLETTPELQGLPPLDIEQMNWDAWDNLVADFQIQDNNGEFLSGINFGV